MNYKLLIIVLVSLSVISCKKTEKKEEINLSHKSDSQAYKAPSIPNVITDPALKADYVMAHYWDNFNFEDTSVLKSRMPEQAFVDFLHVCNSIDEELALTGIKKLTNKAVVNISTLHHFLKLGDRYLYDPNSPFRNDSWYLQLLKTSVDFGFNNEAEKIKYEKRLALCSKNNKGNKAENFKISYIDKSSLKMHAVKSDLLVIYFHNPECEECKVTGKKLADSRAINNLISTGKLNLLSVYTDEDLTIWEKHYDELPSNWINTYNNNAEVKNLEIYDLKAIPTLYLLDKNKNVIMKDAKIEDLLFYLGNI